MGTLRITVDHTVRISARSARVHATVTGSATLTSGVAGRKAALVRELVADLAAHGVPEDAVEVTGVRLSTSDGRLLRSQSVEFGLVVDVATDLLPDVLGVLADRQGLAVDRVEWVYDEFEASVGVTATAMTMARRKADAVAAAAGLEVTGILEASDSWSMPARMDRAFPAPMMAASARGASAPLDLGIELNATSELCVHLSVDFALSP
ncbi:MAG: SIMPL domain-containing protein [Propionicimonas sp.]|uniref:SIMPL domain-containing protein n=1 Tax=Propionicimonas sp. TaxID=1955623 RepID=UPI003D0ADD5E